MRLSADKKGALNFSAGLSTQQHFGRTTVTPNEVLVTGRAPVHVSGPYGNADVQWDEHKGIALAVPARRTLHWRALARCSAPAAHSCLQSPAPTKPPAKPLADNARDQDRVRCTWQKGTSHSTFDQADGKPSFPRRCVAAQGNRLNAPRRVR